MLYLSETSSMHILKKYIPIGNYWTLHKILTLQNPAFTGFFNDGHKRIDLVLVIKDTNSNEIEETRLNFLMNAIKLNLELEIEQGKVKFYTRVYFK